MAAIKSKTDTDFILKLREILEESLPLVYQADREEEFGWALVKKLAPLGIWGMIFPKEYGGLGLSHTTYMLALEELGRIDSSIALTAESHNSLCGNTILSFASEELKRKYLPRMATGEIMGAWALTEPEAGSDAKSLKTEAKLEGDTWVLNGSKTFTTQGSVAGVYVIFAQTEHAGKKGISAFTADKTTPGITIGKKEIKMGLRASDTAQLHIQNLRLPKNHLIGTVNDGFKYAMRILEGGRAAISGISIGMARSAVEKAMQKTLLAPSNGRGEDPGVTATQKIISHYTARIHAVRLLTLQATKLLDDGKPFAFYASLAKLLSGELAMQATTDMMDLLGEEAIDPYNHVTKLFRDAKLYQIGEGTSEIQALLISRHLTANPALLEKPPEA